MMRTSSLEAPRSIAESIVRGLDPYVSSITSRSVLSVATIRAGLRPDNLERTGLNPRLVDEVIRGLSVYIHDQVTLDSCRRVLNGIPRPAQRQPVSGLEVAIKNEQDIVVARNRVRDLAAAIGFTHTNQIKIATAVSELSRNIYSYASTGMILAGPLPSAKSGISIRAVDEGPGISNLEQVLSGAYHSKTGLGLGLRGCKQIMDVFRIVTAPGRGTRITMEKYI